MHLVARQPIYLITAILVLVAFAGCFGGDDPDPEGPGDAKGTTGPSETHGFVHGRVVEDGSLQGITNANVNFIVDNELNASATTDDNGEYEVQLLPGFYRIQVTSACCREGINDVLVEAQQSFEVNFLLRAHEKIVVHDPYVVKDGTWEGMIGCAFAAEDQDPIFPGPCQADPNHSVREIAVFEAGLKTLTLNIRWDEAALGAEQLEFTVHNLNAGFLEIGNVTGSSPLELQIQNDEILDEEKNFDVFEDGWVGRLAVEPVSGSASVIYQQAFTVYYHEHYWEPADDSYTAAPEG